ncbi:unnamed protein product, partial [Mesorhabditis spiculigera]
MAEVGNSSSAPEMILVVFLLWLYYQYAKNKEAAPKKAESGVQTCSTQGTSVSRIVSEINRKTARSGASIETALSPLHHDLTPTSSQVKTGRAESVEDTRKKFEQQPPAAATEQQQQKSAYSVSSESFPVKLGTPYQAPSGTNSGYARLPGAERTPSPNPRAIKPASHTSHEAYK